MPQQEEVNRDSGLRHTLNEKIVQLLVKFRIRISTHNIMVCVTYRKVLVGYSFQHPWMHIPALCDLDDRLHTCAPQP